MAWIQLLIASIFEIAWTFSLKYMDVKKLRSLSWRDFFIRKENWLSIAPFAGYVVFGIGNIVFFSMAMKQIPAATALAVWMGLTLVGVKLLDILVFKQPYEGMQFLYIGLILAGIIGLKRGG